MFASPLSDRDRASIFAREAWRTVDMAITKYISHLVGMLCNLRLWCAFTSPGRVDIDSPLLFRSTAWRWRR